MIFVGREFRENSAHVILAELFYPQHAKKTTAFTELQNQKTFTCTIDSVFKKCVQTSQSSFQSHITYYTFLVTSSSSYDYRTDPRA